MSERRLWNDKGSYYFYSYSDCILFDSYDCRENLLQKTLSVVPSSCLCLRLGYIIVENSAAIYSNEFVSNANAWGSHAQIVFKHYYDEILQKLEEHPIADDTALNINENILLSKKCIFA